MMVRRSAHSDVDLMTSPTTTERSTWLPGGCGETAFSEAASTESSKRPPSAASAAANSEEEALGDG